MANNYKKVLTTVTTTGDSAALYTVPTETTTLIKTAWVYNNSGGAAAITFKINSTDLNTDVAVADNAVFSILSTNSTIASSDIGVLEAGDILKINNDVQPVNVYLAILEIS